ncbi:MAG TPA: lipopolysaccharide heptosyltransferase I [Acidobacteriaceae bacterium]|nr:lipopolysaccharide heptosyltransferase I [Acidobacteriaceae bacterium]
MPEQTKQLRLLVVRLSAMGDILHALPAVTALREGHPEWRIGWAVEPQWKPLLAAEGATGRGPRMPLVDRIHVVPARQWARSPLSVKTFREVRRVRSELRAEQYDVCVDLQGALRSAVIAKWARATRLIGEDAPRERVARYFFKERVRTRGVHVIEQAMEVMNAVAEGKLPTCRALLPRDAEAERKASVLATPFVLLIPGAGWGAKRWPAERYAELATRLRDAGHGVAVNAGPGEEALANEVATLSDGAATVLRLSITELIAVTRRAALVIGGDTGPLHLASALGKPVVGIFGPTDPARNGPFGASFRVLRHPGSRRDHTRHSAPEAGLLTITPESVMAAAMELLQEERVH